MDTKAGIALPIWPVYDLLWVVGIFLFLKSISAMTLGSSLAYGSRPALIFRRFVVLLWAVIVAFVFFLS
jgi:hypothetical protein